MRPLILCLLAACVLSAACQESAGTGGNSSPQPSPSAAANATPLSATPNEAQLLAEAKPAMNAEARASLERVYKRAVAVDESRPDAFVNGDFNGDGSADLAVAVKPSRDALGEINSEFANWIVSDPRAAVPFDPSQTKQTPPPAGPVKIEQSDALLAIVHGHGPEGWRNPQATQSYLLKGVAAAQGLRAVPVRDYPPALVVRKNLNAKADIISGKLAGADGFLYWSRGKYVWHKR
jgi:hypothetical protein